VRRAIAAQAAATVEVGRLQDAVAHLVEVVARRRHDVIAASEERRIAAIAVSELALENPAAIPHVRVDQGQLLAAQSDLDVAADAHRGTEAKLEATILARNLSSAHLRAAAASVAVAHAEELAHALDDLEREATGLRIQLTGVVNALGGQGVQASAFVNEVVRRPPVDIHITNSTEQRAFQIVARRVRRWIEALQIDCDARLDQIEDTPVVGPLPSFITNREPTIAL
jgi:hypothetical protein